MEKKPAVFKCRSGIKHNFYELTILGTGFPVQACCSNKLSQDASMEMCIALVCQRGRKKGGSDERGGGQTNLPKASLLSVRQAKITFNPYLLIHQCLSFLEVVINRWPWSLPCRLLSLQKCYADVSHWEYVWQMYLSNPLHWKEVSSMVFPFPFINHAWILALKKN